MTMRFASRLSRLGTEGAFEVLARARVLEAEGRDIVHLEIGEPDFTTPDNIIEAAYSAMRDGATHYTPAAGLLEARAATAGYVERRTGVAVDPEQVVLAPGSKNILLFALLALVNEGDEVILPDPGYPIYRSLVDFIGARAVIAPINEERDFRLDVDEVAALVTDRTRLLIVNTPANPTGGVLTRSDTERLAQLAIERDLIVLSDEIYSRLTYDSEHVSLYSMPGMPERMILMDGMSKAWAMCGWRLGFGVMPPELAHWMSKLMINTSSCAASFTQLAAAEAFESPESDRAVEAMRLEFQHRRDVLVTGLNSIHGITCRTPAGAFYVFPNITATGWSERDLARSLLDDAGVAVLAGTAFGDHGAGHIRLSYTTSIDRIEMALSRIESHLRAHAPVPAHPVA